MLLLKQSTSNTKFNFISSVLQTLNDLVVICGISQKSSKGDGISDAAQIDEEHGGDGLNVKTLVDVTE